MPNTYVDKGKYPIHKAVLDADIKFLEQLIEHGADVNSIDDSYGNTPIYYAIKENNFAIMARLIYHNANLEIKNDAQKTPLTYAMSVNKPIALFLAIWTNDRLSVAVLLAQNISFNYNGDTPLHIAAFLGNKELIEMILEKTKGEININAINNFSKTSMDLAALNDHTEAVNLLKSKGALNIMYNTYSNNIASTTTNDLLTFKDDYEQSHSYPLLEIPSSNMDINNLAAYSVALPDQPPANNANMTEDEEFSRDMIAMFGQHESSYPVEHSI
jgi:ankyrin repeat protein